VKTSGLGAYGDVLMPVDKKNRNQLRALPATADAEITRGAIQKDAVIDSIESSRNISDSRTVVE